MHYEQDLNCTPSKKASPIQVNVLRFPLCTPSVVIYTRLFNVDQLQASVVSKRHSRQA
jgi:hypothetical protein